MSAIFVLDRCRDTTAEPSALMYTCTKFKHQAFIYVTNVSEVLQVQLEIFVLQHPDTKINLTSRNVVRSASLSSDFQMATLPTETFNSRSGRQREFINFLW